MMISMAKMSMTTRRLTESETTLWESSPTRIRDHLETVGLDGEAFRREARAELRDRGPGHHEIHSHDGIVLDAIDVDAIDVGA
jgi:hypothetical protein